MTDAGGRVEKRAVRRRATAVPVPPPTTFDVRIHRPRSGITLAEVRGAVDAHAAPDLERVLTEAVATSAVHPPRLVLALSAMPSVSVAGVEALMRVERLLTSTGGTMELLDPSPAVVQVLHDAVGEAP